MLNAFESVTPKGKDMPAKLPGMGQRTDKAFDRVGRVVDLAPRTKGAISIEPAGKASERRRAFKKAAI